MPTESKLLRSEIALIKRMLATDGFTKDKILSYFSKPERTINFGRLTDIEKGRRGSDVEPADDKAVAEFIDSFGKARPAPSSEFDPLSPETLATIFRLNRAKDRLIRDESDVFEAKETFHKGGANFAKYARTAAGFANAAGGYLIFGVQDSSLEIVGLRDERFTLTDKAEITQKSDNTFRPQFVGTGPHLASRNEL